MTLIGFLNNLNHKTMIQHEKPKKPKYSIPDEDEIMRGDLYAIKAEGKEFFDDELHDLIYLFHPLIGHDQYTGMKPISLPSLKNGRRL